MLALPITRAAPNLTWWLPSVQPEGPGCGASIGVGGAQLELFGKRTSWVHPSLKAALAARHRLE